MQPKWRQGRHHYHDLKPEEIYEVLSTLKESEDIIHSFDNRYIVLTSVIADCGYPLVAIIDTQASLMNDRDANINKLITLYPKDIKKLK